MAIPLGHYLPMPYEAERVAAAEAAGYDDRLCLECWGQGKHEHHPCPRHSFADELAVTRQSTGELVCMADRCRPTAKKEAT